MVKKLKKEPETRCLAGRNGLFFLGAVLFGALGVASMLQGILLQISMGFLYGFFAYLLGFIFFGAAKCLKWKAYEQCCPPWRMV